jgi:hypothetical protein
MTCAGFASLVPAPVFVMLCFAYLVLFVLSDADAPLKIGDVTILRPREKLVVISTCTMLVCAYPMSAALLNWLHANFTWRVVWHLVGFALMLLSSAALLILLVEPHLPPPGGELGYELCFDVISPAVRFDRALVAGGPCFRFDVAFVAPRSAAALS